MEELLKKLRKMIWVISRVLYNSNLENKTSLFADWFKNRILTELFSLIMVTTIYKKITD